MSPELKTGGGKLGKKYKREKDRYPEGRVV